MSYSYFVFIKNSNSQIEFLTQIFCKVLLILEFKKSLQKFGFQSFDYILFNKIISLIFFSKSLKLRQCMVEMYDVSYVYFFGLAATSVITVLTKVMVGRHRPHFYKGYHPSI